MAKTKISEKLTFPEGVTGSMTGSALTMKGPKGESKRIIKDAIVKVSVTGNEAMISCDSASRREKARAYSYLAHIKNMIKGVKEGHDYELKICASHFPMNVSVANNTLTVKNFLGEKIPRVITIKAGATVKVDGPIIKVDSASKEIAGQVAADIEQLCRITNRDRRVFQDGIYITKKDGKEVI